MTDAPVPQVKLRGCLPQTASSASIRADGSLVVEIFDRGEEAQQWLGRDAAYFLIVAPGHKPDVLTRLAVDAVAIPTGPGADQRLLALIAEHFDDYYAVKKWLEKAGIPYEKDFDSWA